MKHLIFTRFYCIKYGNPTIEDVLLHTPDLLVPGLHNLKKFLIPSLENQTSKNFELVLMIHPKLKILRPEIYNELDNLNTSFPVHLVDYAKIQEYVDSLNEDYIIGTRIDNDDCICKYGVEITQRNFDPNLDFKFFAFMNGAVLYVTKNEIREFISSKWYDNLSSFSIFPSIMTDWRKHKILPIYDHTRLSSFTDNYGIVLTPGKNHIYDYETKLAWLYIRHDTNVSTDKYYKYGDVLTLSDDELKSQFGITLNV